MKQPAQTFHLFRMLTRSVLAALFIFVLITGVTAYADTITLPVLETGLYDHGSAWEVNSSTDGTVWVSDFNHGEIRKYETDGSQMTSYSNLSDVSDARQDLDGMVWFVSQGINKLGRLNPLDGTVAFWNFPDNTNGFATAIDDQGRIWVSDDNHPLISRFDPDPVSPQMCKLNYSTVSDGTSEYIIFDGQYIWFADTTNFKLLRWDVENSKLQPFSTNDWDFYVKGLVSDGAGGIWFSDYFSGALGHLDMSDTEAALYRYNVPAGTDPSTMLTMHNGIIWYTGWDDNSESLGMMNPSEVQFSSSLRLSNNQSIDNLSFNCLTVTQSGSFTATISTLTPTWSQNYINQVPSNIGGWSVYSFDYAVLYGGMFGITYNDGSIWAVDNDRHKLIRHIIEPVNPPTDWVYLPLVIR